MSKESLQGHLRVVYFDIGYLRISTKQKRHGTKTKTVEAPPRIFTIQSILGWVPWMGKRYYSSISQYNHGGNLQGLPLTICYTRSLLCLSSIKRQCRAGCLFFYLYRSFLPETSSDQNLCLLDIALGVLTNMKAAAGLNGLSHKPACCGLPGR